MKATFTATCFPLKICCLVVAVGSVAVTSAAAQQQQPSQWSKLPRMQLERQFAGPLQDTIIQRWRDPIDGVVCYIYLPITAAHSQPTPNGFVEYGANIIGSISCLNPPAQPKPAASHH